jgi:hypothetical protein
MKNQQGVVGFGMNRSGAIDRREPCTAENAK